ncbi:5-formyltetrahydrofolate cyclo-ligase [Ehrlichia ruminantium]|uniref:5-formyltetrahydrofolate cyclo-ligase n=1 Tax=Ehrlichia ruminantium TaxID=779 RepID=UPI0015DC80A5|nr:5-formyltetrahydrofolate cyclo-ligase [Ehrlichia ruminantium]QLK50567.1 5-formyltetrahydrofolate cyclo-ligase [Ehrlichia ruminantium]QLK51492.1 5-formyltetrahydrofolate cyclo-ligase [Ehrlichia ruminantium]QLK53327.1 5-formyltetrahydrofolate cyclo-ligase [Ehrlichia ruminantium]QLK58827.1 5-formyltetrahydrofolate cyclo-ligase [Ehrlichia ruminantium]UOD97489.1 5-formyltetrahydrofolate cyclo-ligase [Ehrlichia ruminantium]
MINIENIHQKKTELRKRYRKLRKEVIHKEEAAHLLLNNYINNVITEGSYITSGYIPIDGEIDVLPLMHHLLQKGNVVAVPVIDQSSKILSFHQWNTTNHIIPNIIIVPLVAFDKKLNRLGFGGGYYDTTIAKLKPHCKTIGIAYNIQLCDKIPTEPHDQTLDMVITENMVYTL